MIRNQIYQKVPKSKQSKIKRELEATGFFRRDAEFGE
jgi:hypothetical protein